MTVVDVSADGRPTEGTRSAPDRWAWRSGPCRALGHVFELRVEPAGLRPELEPVVKPFVSHGSSDDDVTALDLYDVRTEEPADGLPYTLYVNGQRLASGRTGADLTGMLTWHINQSVISRSVQHHVLLHAAAATRGGVTVILPADQESGKTTTVAGLLRCGYQYVTDEAVAIDPRNGRVTPFPKPLSLDPGSWPLFPECAPTAQPVWRRQWHVPASLLGAPVARHQVDAPRVIVFPRYVSGARTRLHPMKKAEAVQELARMSFEFSGFPGRNLRVLARVAAGAVSSRLTIGSLDEAVLAIEELVSERILEEL